MFEKIKIENNKIINDISKISVIEIINVNEIIDEYNIGAKMFITNLLSIFNNINNSYSFLSFNKIQDLSHILINLENLLKDSENKKNTIRSNILKSEIFETKRMMVLNKEINKSNYVAFENIDDTKLEDIVKGLKKYNVMCKILTDLELISLINLLNNPLNAEIVNNNTLLSFLK